MMLWVVVMSPVGMALSPKNWAANFSAAMPSPMAWRA